MTVRLLPQGSPAGPGLPSPRPSPWAFAYMVSFILHDPVSSTVMSAHLGDTILLEFFHHDRGPTPSWGSSGPGPSQTERLR